MDLKPTFINSIYKIRFYSLLGPLFLILKQKKLHKPTYYQQGKKPKIFEALPIPCKSNHLTFILYGLVYEPPPPFFIVKIYDHLKGNMFRIVAMTSTVHKCTLEVHVFHTKTTVICLIRLKKKKAGWDGMC